MVGLGEHVLFHGPRRPVHVQLDIGGECVEGSGANDGGGGADREDSQLS
jgi:hypothetical protein